MTGAIAAIVVAAAGTAYSIHSSEQAKKKAKDQERKMAQDISDEQTKSDAEAARDIASRKQKRNQAQGDRSGTMLTSPLGSLGGNLTDASSGKSLIGQ